MDKDNPANRFPKLGRVVDSVNRNRIQNLPCAVCSHRPPNDCHHIRSRGAGGDDHLRNLLALCRAHHNEVHQIGKKTFYRKHKPQIDTHREWYKLPRVKF